VTVQRTHLTTRLLGLGLPSAAAHSAALAISSSRQTRAPAGVPPALASHVYHAAQLSLANGMQAVLYAMAGVMGAAAVVAWFGLRPGIHVAADAGPAAQGAGSGTMTAVESGAVGGWPE